jgi:hypothetical protein
LRHRHGLKEQTVESLGGEEEEEEEEDSFRGQQHIINTSTVSAPELLLC